MSQTILFCTSYGDIRRTLYLAELYGRERSVSIVVPGIRDLYLFFQEIVKKKALPVEVSLIYLEHYSPRRARVKGIKKLIYILPDIIGERDYLREVFERYFAGVRGGEVYFHNRGFGGLLFYLVKRLSRENRLINTSPTPPLMEPPRKYLPGNITGLASLMIMKLVYGFDVAMGRLPNVRGFVHMTDRFISKTVDRVIGWEEMEETIKGFDYDRYRVFQSGKYRVIYFDNSMIKSGYISDCDVYRQEMAGVFDVLARYFPVNEIARKYHPSYPDDKGLISIGEVLPDFIPAELLYDEKVSLYLGFCSFSIANVERGRVVSLMDMVTFRDEAVKEYLKSSLIRMSKSKIVFPVSLGEFEQLVIESKNK